MKVNPPMWSRLMAIKNHRERRLRAQISRIDAQMDAQTQALGEIHHQRVVSTQRWREYSRKPWAGTADRLHHLRGELNNFYAADLRFQKEGERLRTEMSGLQKQRAELEVALKKCIKKQEKLDFVQRRK